MNQLKKAVVSIIKQMSLGGLALAILAPSTAFGEIPKVGSSCPSYWRSSAGAYCVKSSPASPDAIPKIWRSCPRS